MKSIYKFSLVILVAVLFASCAQNKVAPAKRDASSPEKTKEQPKYENVLLTNKEADVSGCDGKPFVATADSGFDIGRAIDQFKNAALTGDKAVYASLVTTKTVEFAEETAKKNGLSLEESLRTKEKVLPLFLKAPKVKARYVCVSQERISVELQDEDRDFWVPILVLRENGTWKLAIKEQLDIVFKNPEKMLGK